jgi:hypothetical protein
MDVLVLWLTAMQTLIGFSLLWLAMSVAKIAGAWIKMMIDAEKQMITESSVNPMPDLSSITGIEYVSQN